MAATTFDRVYVWERPVRLYHWVTVACMVALVSTGLVMGRPPAFMSAGDASSSYWFGYVRFLHFAAGYVFAFAFLLRVYWMFAGNRYANWRPFAPVTPKLFSKQMREVGQVIKTDILQIDKQPVDSLGHNGLAGLSYAAMFLATIFISVTGFALYAPMSQSWMPHLFTWIVPIMGGDASVRWWHHVTTWFFVIFTMVHVYMTVFHDVVEAKGEISSMVSGSRFVRRP
jgi:Ni/Fe-hydrogenase 1 B-type cytochrome subunit